MTHKHLARVIFTLFLGLALLPPGTGTAENAPRIVWLTPGGGSRVVSPIQVSAEIQPEPDGLVRIELLDRQGQTISRQLLRLDADHNETLQAFTAALPFEIPGDEEGALLTLALLDAYYQPLALRSAEITLHSDGDTQITPSSQPPWLTITAPIPMETVSGGNLVVEGTITPITQKPIIFELTTEKGAVIGSKQLAVEEPGNAQSFKIPLTYTTTITRTVRLVIRQTIDPYSANVILDSLPVILNP